MLSRTLPFHPHILSVPSAWHHLSPLFSPSFQHINSPPCFYPGFFPSGGVLFSLQLSSWQLPISPNFNRFFFWLYVFQRLVSLNRDPQGMTQTLPFPSSFFNPSPLREWPVRDMVCFCLSQLNPLAMYNHHVECARFFYPFNFLISSLLLMKLLAFFPLSYINISLPFNHENNPHSLNVLMIPPHYVTRNFVPFRMFPPICPFSLKTPPLACFPPSTYPPPFVKVSSATCSSSLLFIQISTRSYRTLPPTSLPLLTSPIPFSCLIFLFTSFEFPRVL